jgi:hypothetical protein
LINWGFIYQKHIDSPTYPHLGKVGQIYGNIMVEFHTVVGFCCWFPFFLFFIIMVVLLKGLHLPLDVGRGASPGVFPLCFHGLYVGWVYLFDYLRLFFFCHGWFGLHVILHLHLQCGEGGYNRWKKEID